MLGTLGYISPEQALSGGEDIDTRTDVYALGAVLYELLVGELPLEHKNLAYDEVLRQLREQDAPKPSTRLRTLGTADSILIARQRRGELPGLARQLQGDADTIILKALERDRARRYATPSELAADIGRCLRNEPVVAHAPSVGYRARKYIRRHRLGVAVAASAVLLLIGFVAVQAIKLRDIRRERDRADRITGFMTGMFRVSNPSQARGNAVTAREILDKASQGITAGLSNDPELDEGRYREAEEQYLEVIAGQRRVLGAEHPQTLRATSLLAATLSEEGRFPEADKLQSEVIAVKTRVLGPTHTSTLQSLELQALGLSREGRYPEAR